MKELTEEEWKIILALINDSTFKGQAAEMVSELKDKIKLKIDNA